MKDLEDAGVAHDFEQRFKIDPLGEWIDRNGATRSGYLDEAQERPNMSFSRRNSVSTAM